MDLRASRVVPPLAVAVLTAAMALIPALRDHRFYLTDDSAAQFLPSWYHLGELLRSGQFPLLDPTLWAGGNIAAEALFGIWNPVLLATMVFVSLVPNLIVASVVVKTFFLVLLALGVYGLAREYDVPRGLAAVAGVTVPFAGVTLYFDAASWSSGLTAFTFGCNSLRHLVGGRLDCFTCSRTARVRGKAYLKIGRLNVRHFEWAWISLATVAFADIYIRLAASGVFNDPRIL